MNLRDGFDLISPPWLSNRVAKRLQWTVGLGLDSFRDFVSEGIKLRMPGQGNPDALPYIGRDRLIERGPHESDASYAERLSGAFDTWQKMGNPRPLLEMLRVYFLPATPPIRVVSNRGVWHEIDAAGVVTRTRTSPSNWRWDALALVPRWWRGWVIVDTSAGPFTRHKWGDGGKWGSSGFVWGVDEPRRTFDTLRLLILKHKPAHVDVIDLILCFTAAMFRPTDTRPPNPNGNYDNPTNRDTRAVYIRGGI